MSVGYTPLRISFFSGVQPLTLFFRSMLARTISFLSALFLPSVPHGQSLCPGCSGSREWKAVVSDPSAKYIVGAQVTLTDTDTKAVHAIATDGDGHYALSNLPPGPYALGSESAGLQRLPADRNRS